jgi:probable O-glycosylation ligase (exosortase A-associated)
MEKETRKDRFAFVMLVAFAIQVYAIPGEWITWADPLRLALVTSALAAVAVAVRRLGRAEPVNLGGMAGWALLAMLGLAFLSKRWSVNPAATHVWTLDVAKLVAIYIVTLNVVSSPKRLKWVLGAIVLASIVTSVGAIKWYLHGTDLVEGFRSRWVGVYADPNHLAEDLALIVPLAVAFVMRKPNPLWLKLACGAAAILAVISIIQTHSRGGSIGLLVAMGIWALREKKRLRAVVVGLALLGGLAAFAPKSFWEREQTVGDFREDASAMGRVHAWNVASKIGVDRPLLGVGAGGFRFAWPLYAPEAATQAYVAHNIYLDTLGELGLVGFFFFLIFTGGATGAAFEVPDDQEHAWMARALAAAISGYLVCNLFSGDMISAHLYVFFGLASAAAAIGHAAQRSKAGVGSRPRAVPVPSPALEG